MKMKMFAKVLLVMITLTVLFVPVVSEASAEDQRQHIRDISRTTLLKLYSLQPKARDYVENAAGYGVFGNWGRQTRSDRRRHRQRHGREQQHQS